MKKAILWFFLAYALNLTAYNFYSPAIRLEKVNSSNTKVELQHQNLIVNSEKIIKDSTSLNKPQDYEIDYSSGTINFHQDYGFVLVEYAIYPEKLLREFSSFTVQTLADSEKVQLKRPVFSQVYDDTQLNVSGSKTFKVSVANNEDFALDQSLFLKIDGKLGNNLFITAQLTDSQSPITPEGDSRELSNLDKVFLKLYGKNYDISFGDLEASFNQTRFINYQTKFEGLKASWTGKNEIMGALAISKGKQATDTFSGTEGKQGPYYLSVNNISGVQVVSGSETVYLNGNKLSRGSSYTIDYSEGSVTFTNENFIDSNSFIQVDFQYSDEEYNQNMYLASSKVDFSSLAFLENLQMKTFMIIQNDDKDNPLQQTFSESDKQALAEAGDSEAWVSGVTQVEVGEGLYIKVEEGDLEYYEYVGSQANGEYIIHFTYVGSGGDYEVAEEGYYIFVGDGQGSYSP
ncbi:MAG: hypothetical protein SVM86_05470, partial [Candidatus Cloacimonadota bacterium]|nr:hypothetical protein [Candidatus Cloacimonadota bacterium]